MKIGFPAAGLIGDARERLAYDFTENGIMGVFDTKTENITVVSKDELGVSIMEWLSLEEISAIITPEIKVMALKVFREQGLNIYKAQGSMLALNIELFRNNCLSPYMVTEMFEEGAASCSSSSCSSCDSVSCK